MDILLNPKNGSFLSSEKRQTLWPFPHDHLLHLYHFFSFKADQILSRKMIKTIYLLTLQKKTAKKEEVPLAFSDYIKCGKTVTGSKLMLHTTWQMNKSRDEVLGQGIVTLFREPADWETSGRVSPKNHLTRVRIQAPSKLKGKEVWLIVAPFFVLAAVHVQSGHNVSVNLQQDNVTLCSTTCYLHMDEKCYTLKGPAWQVESWEGTGMSISGYRQDSFTEMQIQHD